MTAPVAAFDTAALERIFAERDCRGCDLSVADLPEEIRAQAEGLLTIWSVHRPDGERVALVRDRGMAFALSRQNDMVPVNVH